MTDARLAALEAVAEAAVELDKLFNSGCPYLSDARNKMHLAIRALRAVPAPPPTGCISAAPTGCVSDSECAAAGRCLERPALPAPATEPAGEVVTLALWRSMSGEVMLDIAGSNGDVPYNETWRRLGTVTLPIKREGGE